jgi:hypothetical protein
MVFSADYFKKLSIYLLVASLIFFVVPLTTYAAVTGIAEFGGAGTGDGQFNFDSTGIAIDSSGNVYVADGGNNRIQKFDSSGTYITQWGTVGTGDGEMTQPDDVAIDSNGDVWVLDNTRVQKFSNTGTFIASYNGTDQGGTSFSADDHLAIDSDDNVYVLDYQVIQVFTSDMTFVESFDGDDKGGDSFTSTSGMEFDASNNLYVNTGGKIQKFDDNNNFVTSWTGGGTTGLGVTPDGTVYTSQSSSTQIKKYTTDGTFIESFSCFGSGVTCLSGPSDIDFYGQTVYVAEQGPGYSSDRVNIFTDTGISSNPFVTNFSPADNATGVDVGTDFVLTFNEDINEPHVYIEFAFGLYKASDDSAVYEIPNSSPVLNVSDNTFSLNSLGDLDPGTEYYIQIGDDYLDDDEGNYYAGIDDATTWNFTTAGTAPSEASEEASGLRYAAPPTCTADFSSQSIKLGEEVTLSWNASWNEGFSRREYFVKVPKEGLFPMGVQSVSLKPKNSGIYRIALFNLFGSNFCEAAITVLDENGQEVVSEKNSLLTASAASSGFFRPILSFFSSLFVR